MANPDYDSGSDKEEVKHQDSEVEEAQEVDEHSDNSFSDPDSVNLVIGAK